MKKFPFLLLDAGPIIKLFELGIWDEFIKRCDVTIPRTIVEDETIYADREDSREYIEYGLKSYEDKGQIKIIDADSQKVKWFLDKFDSMYKSIIHDGEKEALAFLYNNSEPYKLCTSDSGVFKVLGLLGKGEQGISLEEVLQQIGRLQELEKWYTKKFREQYTRMGQADFIQDKGLR